MKFSTITFCLCALFNSGLSTASPVPDFPFLQADGIAKREVPPTFAEVKFTVLSYSKSSEESSSTVEAALAKVIATLKELGVKEDQFKAGDVHKSMTRNRDRELYKDTEITGYEIYRVVELKVPDLKNYAKIANALMKADNVSGVDSKFDTTMRDEVESKLIGEACGKARKHADMLAKGAGVVIASVYAVNTHGFSNLESNFGFSYKPDMFGAGSDPSPDIQLFVPTSISLGTSVSILYRLNP